MGDHDRPGLRTGQVHLVSRVALIDWADPIILESYPVLLNG